MSRITISISISAADFVEVNRGNNCMSLTTADGSHDLFVHGTQDELRAFAGRVFSAAHPVDREPAMATEEDIREAKRLLDVE